MDQKTVKGLANGFLSGTVLALVFYVIASFANTQGWLPITGAVAGAFGFLLGLGTKFAENL